MTKIKNFETKDSGKKETYSSGMNRDVQNDKPRFDLICAKDSKYEETLLYRWAMLMARGADKYDDRNWEKANSLEEFERFKASACRHFMQLMSGEEDEDHFSAVCFNLQGMLYLMEKLNINVKGEKNDK